MLITHKFEMAVDRRGPAPLVDAVQGDTNTREILLSLVTTSAAGTKEPWKIPDDVSVLVRFRKPDGSGGIYDTMPDGTSAVSYSENTVRALLAPQVLTVPGCVLAQMELKNGEDVLGTFMFKIMVERDPSIGAMDSQDYINLSQYVSAEVQKILSGKGTNRILLWDDRTYLDAASCPSGTIVDLPVDDYTGIEVIFAGSKPKAQMCSTGFLPVGITTYYSAIGRHLNTLVSRWFSYNPKNCQIVFQAGCIHEGGVDTTDDTMMLPIRIYGYK